LPNSEGPPSADDETSEPPPAPLLSTTDREAIAALLDLAGSSNAVAIKLTSIARDVQRERFTVSIRRQIGESLREFRDDIAAKADIVDPPALAAAGGR
jgi:hypothetical protein